MYIERVCKSLFLEKPLKLYRLAVRKGREVEIRRSVYIMGDNNSSLLVNQENNPCENVRVSCLEYYNYTQQQELSSPHVTINLDATKKVAKQIIQQQQKPIEWDEENWHYNLMKHNYDEHMNTNCIDTVWTKLALNVDSKSCTWSQNIKMERVALYILALDAINFCFWPAHTTDCCNVPVDDTGTPVPTGFEYEHLAKSLKYMAHQDHTIQNQTPDVMSESYIFSPTNLATMTPTEMDQLFQKYCYNNDDSLKPPDIEKRVKMWNHIGQVLINEFDGRVMNMIQQANGSASALVHIIVTYFPNCFGGDYITTSFVDVTNQKKNLSKNIYFYKRAQIFVGDLNASLELHFPNMNELTMFADYRVPQILQHLHVLQYSHELSNVINQYEEIELGSTYEVSIRAATVTAVEWLVQELNQLETLNTTKDNDPKGVHQVRWTAMLTDWYLWQLGEKMMNENKLLPHHRVRTIYY